MKIRKILVGVCVAAMSASVSAAGPVDFDARACLLRGVEMYDAGNFAGAVDRLSYLKNILPQSEAEMAEVVDYYLAMCGYELGENASLNALNDFNAKYPGSKFGQEIDFAIGNYYFFHGLYGEAVKSYRKISEVAFAGETRADLLYRIGFSELKLGEFASAEKYFKKVRNNSKYRDACHFYEGYLAYLKKDYDAAQRSFNALNKQSELWKKSRYYVAQINFVNGNYDAVVSEGRKLLNENDHEFTAELYRLIGESEFLRGNDSEAEQMLVKYAGKCVYTEPQRSALYTLGVLADRRGDTDGVVEWMNRVTGVDDGMAQSAYLYLGQAYVAKYDTNAAMMAFEKAMRMNFDSDVRETAFYNYVVAQSRGSRTPFGSAIENFEEFVNLYPNSRYLEQVEGYLINAYIYGNDFHKAYESIGRIQDPTPKVLTAKQYVCYNLGSEALSNGKTDDAVVLFKDARNIGDRGNGVWSDCALWLGNCYYKEGKYELAEKNLRAYIQEAGPRSANYYKAHYDIAYAQFQQRKYDNARANFNVAAKNRSGLSAKIKADANSRIGDTYYYNRDYNTAARYYNKAVDANPSAGDYALYQEALMNGLQKRYSVKVEQLNDLMSKYPNSPLLTSAMLEKAQAQIAMGKKDDAVATFKSLIAGHPGTPEARRGQLQLAITYKNLGEIDHAVNEYKRVVTMFPSSDEAALAVEDMKVIFAERGDMAALQKFLAEVPNAPKIEITELDRLAFNSAERKFLGQERDISQVRDYLKNYPDGAYAVNARYYLASDCYNNGNYDEALENLNEVLAKGSDASFAEDALAMKGEILMKQRDYTGAFAAYQSLNGKATTTGNRVSAKMGIMRAATELGKYDRVVDAGNSLLDSGLGMDSDIRNEAVLLRADANYETGNVSNALAGWKSLSKDTRNIYGAKSAFCVANHYFRKEDYKSAESALNNFIDEGTPHEYWLARAFILLSDVYVKQGKNFEAKEYLESLKSNYPGSEQDIFDSIESRLAKLNN